MAVNGTASIFRITNSLDTETDVTDKVEFGTGATQPDGKSFIRQYKPLMALIGQENPNPDSNNPNVLDETGLALVTVEIWGWFDSTDGTRAAGISRIRDWLKDGNQKNSNFPEGRFGIRNDTDDEFDLVPTSSSGYIIEHFECPSEYAVRGRTDFYIKLRMQGDITDLSA